jgi:hypothetical protein
MQPMRWPDHKLSGDIMVIRVGVNGFGRVGRNFFRAVDAQRAAGTTVSSFAFFRVGYTIWCKPASPLQADTGT